MFIKYCERFIRAVLLFASCTRCIAAAECEEKFRIEGRARVYGVRPEEWTPLAHVLLDGEEHVGFVRSYIIKKTTLQCNAPALIPHAFSNHCSFPLDLMEVSQ